MAEISREEILKRYAQYEAEQRKQLGDSFLVALYNLRFPKEQISLEDKRRLSYVVFTFFDFPASNLYDALKTANYHRPTGFTNSDGFSIHPDMIGYAEPEPNGIHRPGKDAWWNSPDFDAFQRNLKRLCGCIESCIEGENYWNFCPADLEWFQEKVKLIHFSIHLLLKQPVFLVGSKTPGTVRPARPEEVPSDVRPPFIPLSSMTSNSRPTPARDRKKYISAYLDFPRSGGAWRLEESEDGTVPFEQFSPVIVPGLERDMPPSDLILHQAYLELMTVINTHQSFGRCKATATQRRPACQNIFPHKKQRGPKKRWCSDTCRRRIHEAKKAKN